MDWIIPVVVIAFIVALIAYTLMERRQQAAGCVLLGLEEDGEEIPAPTPLAEIKTRDNECAVLVDVYMPSIRQAHNNRAVNRTVTLPAWLNAAALEHNINFSQVLQDALKSKLHLG